MPLLKWIDLPPVWLFICCALAWWIGHIWPMGGEPFFDVIAAVLVGAGLWMTWAALTQFRTHRTTPIPHRTASALITTGIFARSRNPIYLSDALILTGLIVWWRAWPALILVPVFVKWIEYRFVGPEERRLADAFGTDFADYAARVGRWF